MLELEHVELRRAELRRVELGHAELRCVCVYAFRSLCVLEFACLEVSAYKMSLSMLTSVQTNNTSLSDSCYFRLHP